jgi:hypothetical protein
MVEVLIDHHLHAIPHVGLAVQITNENINSPGTGEFARGHIGFPLLPLCLHVDLCEATD